MKRTILRLVAILALAALPTAVHAKKPAASPSPAAMASPSAAATQAETKPKRDTYPFHGKLSAVDTAANTFTLESKKAPRVFHVTPETKIVKNGAPATLKDAVVGDDVGGMVHKETDGTLTARSVRFGPKPEKTTTAASSTSSTSPAAAATPKPHKKKQPAAAASVSPSATP